MGKRNRLWGTTLEKTNDSERSIGNGAFCKRKELSRGFPRGPSGGAGPNLFAKWSSAFEAAHGLCRTVIHNGFMACDRQPAGADSRTCSPPTGRAFHTGIKYIFFMKSESIRTLESSCFGFSGSDRGKASPTAGITGPKYNLKWS